MEIAPIALFAYKRPEHLQKTIDALRLNPLASESVLYVFSDGAKAEKDRDRVRTVRRMIGSIQGFKSVKVIERGENFGLAKSILSGVSEVLEQHDRVIVLEDDLLTSPYFLRFMNDALNLYKDNDKVTCVHGYSYFERYGIAKPAFLLGADCLGWGTWRRAWDRFETNAEKLAQEIERKGLRWEFNLDGAYDYWGLLRAQLGGAVDSWAIRWRASAFLQGLYTLYPHRSLIFHIGNDGSGTHYHANPETDPLNVPLCMDPIPVSLMDVNTERDVYRAFQRAHIRLIGSKKSRFLARIRCLIYPMVRMLKEGGSSRGGDALR